MRNPEVSICVPVFNGENFLFDSISGILNQSFSDFELIIIDDCSSDASFKTAKSFTDKRIRLYRNDARLGLVRNWNKCLELSRGKYICIFHQDDVMLPHNIARKVKVLNENPEAGFVYSGIYQINEKGENIDGHAYWSSCNPGKDTFLPAGKGFEFLSAADNPVCCPSVVMKRECFELLGIFTAELPFTSDWEMWMRISLFYGTFFISEPLLKYRWHKNNETLRYSPSRQISQKWKAKKYVITKFKDKIKNQEQVKKNNSRLYAALSWAEGLKEIRRNFKEGISCLTLSARLYLS